MKRFNVISRFAVIFVSLLTVIGNSLADERLQRILALPPQVGRDIPLEGWRAYGGDWQLEDNSVITVSASDGPKLVCTAKELAHLTRGEVSVELFFPEESPRSYANAGILLHLSEVGTGADAFVGYEVALSPENRHLNIGLHCHDYRPRQQIACNVPKGKWCKLHVIFDGVALNVLLDDKPIVSYRDTAADAVLAGGIALRAWQRTVKYRNLRIKNLDAANTVNHEWKSLPFRVMPTIDKATTTDVRWHHTLATDNLPPILFLTRYPLTQPNSVGNDIWMSRPTAWGCSIRLAEPANPGRAIRTIFSDPDGCLYDINLSLDAQTIYFSHCTKDDPYWHLWRIGVDGSGLKQLTEGAFHDASPCETAAGDLIFVSTRRFGHTVCQPGPASNLHRLTQQGNGGYHIDCVSMNTLSDMSPQLMSDGHIIFTRWEYIDRDLTYRQSLWTQQPDGTDYKLFFGNTIRDVGTFWQARPLPDSHNRLIATFAPHHGYPHGIIGLIDRGYGIEGKKGEGFVYLTDEITTVGDNNIPWGYRDPFPLTNDTFLCSFGGWNRQGSERRFGLYLLNSEGQKRMLYDDPQQSCFFPIPLLPAPPMFASLDRCTPVTNESLTNPDEALFGTVVLSNVYDGLQDRVAPGTIVALRVMEQVRKTEDLINRAYDQSPVMGYGTYYAKRSWGTVPVEKDGSAHFTVPALREIYLQALDADGREVQRMTSAMQIMPNEQVSCLGCHENRDAAPTAARTSTVPIAARKPPFTPRNPDWFTNRPRLNPLPDARIIDYQSIVQPVLDKYCIECHNGDRTDGGYDLTGDRTRFFSMSYDNLIGTSRSYRQHDLATGAILPEEAAKGKPLIHFFWLLFTPTAVNEPCLTGSHASRLTELLDSDHAGVVIPSEDRQRIAMWVDANVPYYGTYAHARPNAPGRRDRCADPVTGDDAAWFRDFRTIYDRRCRECHGSFDQPDHRDWIGRYAWINFDHPERSAALRTHLTATKDGKPPLFTSTNDPDYRAMLSAIIAGQSVMILHPEADSPGFSGARAEP